MNFLSLNIRGMGEDHKVSWIRRLRSVHNLSFIAIQETQILDAEHIDVVACWGSSEVDVSRINSYGRSGGLLNLWDARLFKSLEIISSRHYLINIGSLVGVQKPVIFANVYGPQLVADKARLWKELKEIIETKDGVWVLMGDFNAV